MSHPGDVAERADSDIWGVVPSSDGSVDSEDYRSVGEILVRHIGIFWFEATRLIDLLQNPAAVVEYASRTLVSTLYVESEKGVTVGAVLSERYAKDQGADLAEYGDPIDVDNETLDTEEVLGLLEDGVAVVIKAAGRSVLLVPEDGARVRNQYENLLELIDMDSSGPSTAMVLGDGSGVAVDVRAFGENSADLERAGEVRADREAAGLTREEAYPNAGKGEITTFGYDR